MKNKFHIGDVVIIKDSVDKESFTIRHINRVVDNRKYTYRIEPNQFNDKGNISTICHEDRLMYDREKQLKILLG